VPDISGIYIVHSVNIQADPQTVDEIMTAFKQAEKAVQHGDLDAVMAFYAEGYQHLGFTKESLRTEWENLFQEYHDFSTTHIFTSISARLDNTPPSAEITCTGNLWAISKANGQRVNIDSWFGEVHYLTHENAAWRIRGHAWDPIILRQTRTPRPPHPFF
jgi:ketosteroid isomerase-like protein